MVGQLRRPVVVQMYWNITTNDTFPDFTNLTPNYTFLVPNLTSATLPGFWSMNVS